MRYALITGASSDIGISTVRAYLDSGWGVYAHYRTPRPELLHLRDSGAPVIPFSLDFSDAAVVERELAMGPDWALKADALVTLAADARPTRFETFSAAELAQVLATNVISTLLVTRVCAQAMANRGWGRIVHGSSIGVKFGGGADSFAYSLSKHALEFQPEAYRRLAAAGVLVNVVRIGVTDTRIHQRFPGKDMAARAAKVPMGRLATPDEIARSIHWLGSELNTFNCNQIISVSGGE